MNNNINFFEIPENNELDSEFELPETITIRQAFVLWQHLKFMNFCESYFDANAENQKGEYFDKLYELFFNPTDPDIKGNYTCLNNEEQYERFCEDIHKSLEIENSIVGNDE